MSNSYLESKKTQRSILRHIREQVKKHCFGKLIFLASVGPQAWGFASENMGHNYQGLYLSKEDNTYNVFLCKYESCYPRAITLISFERIIENILRSEINSLIFINSFPVFASKHFLEFKKQVNSQLSKQVYFTCQPRKIPLERRDYLNQFFFLGNGIAVLEKKKIIANLPQLNNKILKISAIDQLIEQEKTGAVFENKKQCEQILKKLKTRLKIAHKKSCLLEIVDEHKFTKLKIMKKINFYFWYWPKGSRESSRRNK